MSTGIREWSQPQGAFMLAARSQAVLGFLPCLVTILLLTPCVARADLHPNERGGWVVGLGLGGGSAGIHVDGESSDRQTGATGNLHGGYFLNPKVSIGVEGNMWFKTIEGVDWTFDTFTAAVALYPGDGFFLRAGAGGGSASAEVENGSITESQSESGIGATGGAGYEIRVARSWAVVPQIDVSYLHLDSFDANWVSFGVAAHWYILPR
jgi:outer membrane autotransporter protein